MMDTAKSPLHRENSGKWKKNSKTSKSRKKRVKSSPDLTSSEVSEGTSSSTIGCESIFSETMRVGDSDTARSKIQSTDEKLVRHEGDHSRGHRHKSTGKRSDKNGSKKATRRKSGNALTDTSVVIGEKPKSSTRIKEARISQLDGSRRKLKKLHSSPDLGITKLSTSSQRPSNTRTTENIKEFVESLTWLKKPRRRTDTQRDVDVEEQNPQKVAKDVAKRRPNRIRDSDIQSLPGGDKEPSKRKRQAKSSHTRTYPEISEKDNRRKSWLDAYLDGCENDSGFGSSPDSNDNSIQAEDNTSTEKRRRSRSRHANLRESRRSDSGRNRQHSNSRKSVPSKIILTQPNFVNFHDQIINDAKEEQRKFSQHSRSRLFRETSLSPEFRKSSSERFLKLKLSPALQSSIAAELLHTADALNGSSSSEFYSDELVASRKPGRASRPSLDYESSTLSKNRKEAQNRRSIDCGIEVKSVLTRLGMDNEQCIASKHEKALARRPIDCGSSSRLSPSSVRSGRDRIRKMKSVPDMLYVADSSVEEKSSDVESKKRRSNPFKKVKSDSRLDISIDAVDDLDSKIGVPVLRPTKGTSAAKMNRVLSDTCLSAKSSRRKSCPAETNTRVHRRRNSGSNLDSANKIPNSARWKSVPKTLVPEILIAPIRKQSVKTKRTGKRNKHAFCAAADQTPNSVPNSVPNSWARGGKVANSDDPSSHKRTRKEDQKTHVEASEVPRQRRVPLRAPSGIDKNHDNTNTQTISIKLNDTFMMRRRKSEPSLNPKSTKDKYRYARVVAGDGLDLDGDPILTATENEDRGMFSSTPRLGHYNTNTDVCSNTVDSSGLQFLASLKEAEGRNDRVVTHLPRSLFQQGQVSVDKSAPSSPHSVDNHDVFDPEKYGKHKSWMKKIISFPRVKQTNRR